MSKAWYVAKIHRGKEAALQQQLEPLGVHLFNPRIVVHRSGRRRLEPVFPTYLFLEGDPEEPTWPTAQRARGIKYLLGSEHEAMPVGQQLVQGIASRVQAWNAGGWREVFKPGQRVSVQGGPMKGLEGIFKQYVPAKERCRLLISTLAMQHEVELDLRMVTPLRRDSSQTILP